MDLIKLLDVKPSTDPQTFDDDKAHLDDLQVVPVRPPTATAKPKSRNLLRRVTSEATSEFLPDEPEEPRSSGDPTLTHVSPSDEPLFVTWLSQGDAKAVRIKGSSRPRAFLRRPFGTSQWHG